MSHARRLLVMGTLLPAATLAAAADARPDERPPNIVFLFADDQRFDTLGCAGHPIVRTPHLDRLAASGVRFENAFVTTPVCWVSRAVVLSGQWARGHGERTERSKIRADALARAFPVRLRERGYRTAFYGKWHLRGPEGFGPRDLFDVVERIDRNPYLKPQPDGSLRHEAQLIADRAIDFLAARDRTQPFCLCLWFNTAHAEDGDRRPGHLYQWPATVEGLYDDVAVPSPRLGDPAIFAAQPEFLKQSLNRERWFWGYDTPERYTINLRAYYRMLTGLDHEVGRVLAALDAHGAAENTVIVYSADNGYYLGDRGFQGKWSHYEESLRVPLIVFDPRLPDAQRGRVRPELVLNVDLPATFLDWAGAPREPADQGRSLAPLVRGESPGDWRTDFFCEHLDLAPRLVWEGVRGTRYVYARYLLQQPVYEFLHDLQSDPDELQNLTGDPRHAAALTELRRRCDELAAELGPALDVGEH